jgi:hypothetical protein
MTIQVTGILGLEKGEQVNVEFDIHNQDVGPSQSSI